MKQFEICFIDDRHNPDWDDYGWQILVRPFVTPGLFFGGYCAGTPLKFDEEQTLCFTLNSKLKEPLGAKGLILTKIQGKIDTFDDLLKYVGITNSDVYVIDIDLSEFSSDGQKKQELKFGGLKVANILKDKPALKILYSAFEKTQEIRTTILSLPNYISDIKLIEIGTDEIDQATGRGNIKSSKQQLLTMVENHLQKRQIDIIQENLEPDQVSGLRGMVESLDPNVNDWIKQIEKKIICSGNNHWNLRTLFPKEINTIESVNENDASEMKRRILEVLEADFRTLICKISNWHKIEQKIKMAMGLDMTVESKEGQTIEYDHLKFTDFASGTARKFLGLGESSNFSNTTFQYKLKEFASDRCGNAFEINISLWNQDSMVKEFGIYWGQLLNVFKIAVQNHIVYQKNSDNSYQTFEIKVCREDDNLIISIISGTIPTNSSMTLDNQSKEITFSNGRSIKFGVGTSEAIQPGKLRTLNSEKITDILKIVCYLWGGEFEFKCGGTAALFTWDHTNRTFDVKMKEFGENHSVIYIIRLKKPCYHEVDQ